MKNISDFSNYSKRFQWILENRGINQKQLAEIAEVSGTAITDIMKGKAKSPRAEIIDRISRKLDVDPGWLLSGKGDPNSKSYSDYERGDQELLIVEEERAAYGGHSKSINAISQDIESLKVTKQILIDEISQLSTMIRDKDKIIILLEKQLQR